MESTASVNRVTHPVKNHHVHKKNEENVFIEDVAMIDMNGAKSHTFMSRIILNQSHPFFFERDRTHAPGLYLVEAGRQMGVAVAHLFYGVPFEHEFILESLEVQFKSFANLHAPIRAVGTMSEFRFRRGEFHSALFGGVISQNDREFMELSGRLSVLNGPVMRRMERINSRKAEPTP